MASGQSLASTVNLVSIRSTVYRNGEHSVYGMSFSYCLRQRPASKKHYLKKKNLFARQLHLSCITCIVKSGKTNIVV